MEAFSVEKHLHSTYLEEGKLSNLDLSNDSMVQEFVTNPTDSRSVEASEAISHKTVPALPSLPGYRVLSLLGRGGMGDVFLAEHIALRRQVALKVISTGLQTSPAAMARFQSEALAVASVAHPGVCQIFESGQSGTTSYLAMEYIDGQTLSQVIRVSPPSPIQAARMAQSIAEAVQACHVAGVLHRDLKPANIMLTRMGSIKVMDFGLAKRFTEENSSNTSTGDIVGTPSYMAPEQASGLIKQLGPECDVYGIGAILYELLVGRPPHYGDSPMQTILQVLTAEPASPRSLQTRVPRDLETVCLKCLEKQAKRRYRSAAALAEDIDRFLTQLPLKAKRATLPERATKWTKRNPVLAVFGLMVVVLVAGAVVALRLHWSRLQSELDRSERLFTQSQEWGSWLVDKHIPSIAKLRGGGKVRTALVERTLTHLIQLEKDIAADRELALYIAHTYEHIADVESDETFAMPEGLERAITHYESALTIYSNKLDQNDTEIQATVAQVHLKLSRLYALLHRKAKALESCNRSVQILEDLGDASWNIRLIEAKTQQVSLYSDTRKPAELITEYERLITQIEKCYGVQGHPSTNNVLAKLAVKLGDCFEGDSDLSMIPRQERIAKQMECYKRAKLLWTESVASDEKLRLELSRVSSKLGDCLARQSMDSEADATLRDSIKLLQQLVLEVPESDLVRLELIETLSKQFQNAKKQGNISAEFEIVGNLFPECERLYHLNPKQYARQMLKGLLLSAEAHHDSGREDAIGWMQKASDQAREIVQIYNQPVDRRVFADVLYRLSKLHLEFVEKRSDRGRRVRALEVSLDLLRESLSLYDSLHESTSMPLGAPFWLATELKHQVEAELDFLHKTRNETRGANHSRLNQQ